MRGTLPANKPLVFDLTRGNENLNSHGFTFLKNFFLLVFLMVGFVAFESLAQRRILDRGFYHVRNGHTREWSEFPAQSDKKELTVHFPSRLNEMENTLSLRQYDVRQNWRVILNDLDLGALLEDEKDLFTYFIVPPFALRNGMNTLQIKCLSDAADDIKVGEISLDMRPLNIVLSEASMDVEVTDGDLGILLPSRITITRGDRVLQTVSAANNASLAIRPGYVYTGNGKASLRLPSGTYTVYATRGFEYGVDSAQLVLKPGDHIKKNFSIRREVPTEGWISSDTHVHTYTHSGHGDANEDERVLTIAGEGVELPVITDHNVHVDLKPKAVANRVDRYFTTVVGNEVTTEVGHFNVFPLATTMPVVDHRASEWKTLSGNLRNAEHSPVIILNHGRDVHKGFRPFDPARHVASAGMRLDSADFFPNAMEVINSGSQQTDIMRLFRDWFGLLNRGHTITPVGSSDSHDVSRFFVGQGRTYIKGADTDPGNINIDEAVKSFLRGNVIVSLGLVTKISVNSEYGPGDVVSATEKVNVKVEVFGPSWIRAQKVMLYANGIKIREANIASGKTPGLKWSDTWQVSLPKHDIFLVAIAQGPGHDMPYWPIAKPYQPASGDWHPSVLSSTGAIWVDVDKNGQPTSALEYAKELVQTSKADVDKLVKLLETYDEAVAIQAASLLWKKGISLKGAEVSRALSRATRHVKSGFETFIKDLPADK